MVNHIDDRPLFAPIGEDGEPILQVDRLDAVVKHALTSENWNQHAWMHVERSGDTACGTSYCIAGFAAVEFAGLEPVFINSFPSWVNSVRVGGGERFISSAARDYLGLTNSESNDLFDGDNTADDVTTIVEKIKNGEYRR